MLEFTITNSHITIYVVDMINQTLFKHFTSVNSKRSLCSVKDGRYFMFSFLSTTNNTKTLQIGDME